MNFKLLVFVLIISISMVLVRGDDITATTRSPNLPAKHLFSRGAQPRHSVPAGGGKIQSRHGRVAGQGRGGKGGNGQRSRNGRTKKPLTA